MLPVRKRLLLDGWMPTLKYKDSGTFTAGMAKRLPPAGPFAAAPIIQGKWDGTGTPDVVSFPCGTLMGNATGFCYSNIDPYQGTISFWITPEWAGGDNLEHAILYSTSTNMRLIKAAGNVIRLYVGGTSVESGSVAAWAAGTTYHVVVSWSVNRTIDGTNYGRVSLNNAHVYGMTTQPTPVAPATLLYMGTNSIAVPANALIQGLTIWRRVLVDSNGYGDNVGQADEIGQIYA
jgi:hypothetical protein